MAKVTGFTADRMLVIENETVVDGQVQGDNLILMTREGTPIDAGNVRGPAGPAGPAGGISSVNDQTSGAVYAPRIFSTKAALDSGWTAAPAGSMAVTTDTETVWEKNASGWVVVNPSRIFASTADRDARWANPPEGAIATTVDGDVSWYKAPAGWNISNGIRVFASGAERDARWPSPPIGSLAITSDSNVLWQRSAAGWQPPNGTLVYSAQAAIPDLATGAIWPGWASNVYGIGSVNFPYPTRIQCLVSFSCGYGADWISWFSHLTPFHTGAPESPNVNDSSGQAVWSSSSLLHMYDVPAGVNVGFNHYFQAGGMGGNSTNVHTGGQAGYQVFSRM